MEIAANRDKELVEFEDIAAQDETAFTPPFTYRSISLVVAASIMWLEKALKKPATEEHGTFLLICVEGRKNNEDVDVHDLVIEPSRASRSFGGKAPHVSAPDDNVSTASSSWGSHHWIKRRSSPRFFRSEGYLARCDFINDRLKLQ